MDATLNPYTPGAGTPPLELAGRDDEIGAVKLLLARVAAGRHQRSMIITGLRGVGKTVLLNQFEALAAEAGWVVALQEIPSPRDHPRDFRELAASMVRRAMYDLSRGKQMTDAIKHAFGVLRSFRPKVTIGESGALEFSIDIARVDGLADSGNITTDLGDLLVELGRLAKSQNRPVLFLFDEVQYLGIADLAALVTAIHRVDQKSLPVSLIAAGLPQLPALVGEAKSYAERLFDFRRIGQLDDAAARRALVVPARPSLEYSAEAIALLLVESDRYPHFIQEWGWATWNCARRSPATPDDVRSARTEALASLDRGFFDVRYERATARERDYLRAMAALGQGPYRSGAVAERLGVKPSGAAPIRDGLMAKGLVYAPSYGLIDFTVPHFDTYLGRRAVEIRGR